MTTLLAIGGVLGAVTAAGFVRDRVVRRRPQPRFGDDSRARYYNDVRDSSDHHHGFRPGS